VGEEERRKRLDEEEYKEECCDRCYHCDDTYYCHLWKRYVEPDDVCDYFDQEGVYAPIPEPMLEILVLRELGYYDDP